VLAQSPAPVALLVDRGLGRAFAPDTGQRRVLVALSGGAEDPSVLDLAEHVLRDAAVSLTLLLVTASGSAEPALAQRLEALAATHPGRVELRADHVPARHQALLAAANAADLVLLGLDEAWGLSADGLEPDAARLMVACPASLLVIQHRRAET